MIEFDGSLLTFALHSDLLVSRAERSRMQLHKHSARVSPIDILTEFSEFA